LPGRALVNGAAGFVVAQSGRPVSAIGFTVTHGKIVEIDLLADSARLRGLDLTGVDDWGFAHDKECKMSVPLIASRITLAAHETGGTIGIIENLVEPGWPGPPLHHHAFDETFCILEGELTFRWERIAAWAAPEARCSSSAAWSQLANLFGGSARYLLVCTRGGFEQRFGPDADGTPSGPNTDVIVVGLRIPEMDAERWARTARVRCGHDDVGVESVEPDQLDYRLPTSARSSRGFGPRWRW
jgi:uncharacterized cupin superfamily protein